MKNKELKARKLKLEKLKIAKIVKLRTIIGGSGNTTQNQNGGTLEGWTTAKE
ncbi:hypothetical protein ACSTS3_18510 [Aquimarina muelleri]|uniref:hypothetical protein n=1 Tax=Aquimarina muelleri TaxID=279356 RepID=UPI003F687786